MHARSIRFPLMDSLRAIAALLVLGTHAAFFSQALVGWDTLQALATRLESGVTVFFQISGFLLYRPFVAARFASDEPPLARAYAWRRLLRIVPAYWTALTGSAIWLGLSIFSASGILIYYGLGQIYFRDYSLGGIPQAWSLCVEIAFYLFLPVYAWLMRKVPAADDRARLRTELAGLGALVVIAFAWQLWRVSVADDPDHANAVQGLLYLPSFFDHFALGMGLAVASVAFAGRSLPGPLALVERFPVLPWLGAAAAFWAASRWIGLDGVGGLREPVTGEQYFARHYLYGLFALGLLLPAVFGDPREGSRPALPRAALAALPRSRVVRDLPVAPHGLPPAPALGLPRGRDRAGHDRDLGARRDDLGHGDRLGQLLADRASRAQPEAARAGAAGRLRQRPARGARRAGPGAPGRARAR